VSVWSVPEGAQVKDLSDAIVRLWRLARPSRNPLARVSDRLEAALLITMVSGMALAFPLAAIVGQSSYAAQVAASTRNALSHHRATAIVLQDTPAPIALSEGLGTINTTATTPAQWSLPDGTLRTGNLNVPSGSRAGTTIRIWVSATGDPVAPPAPSSRAVTNGVLAGVFTWLGVAALLVAARGGGRRILDHRRFAGWEQQWAAMSGRSDVQ
jgi:hypothetical protein